MDKQHNTTPLPCSHIVSKICQKMVVERREDTALNRRVKWNGFRSTAISSTAILNTT